MSTCNGLRNLFTTLKFSSNSLLIEFCVEITNNDLSTLFPSGLEDLILGRERRVVEGTKFYGRFERIFDNIEYYFSLVYGDYIS